MAIEYNQDRIMKDIGIKTSENSQEFFEIGADAKNVFIQDAEHTRYGDADGVVDLQTKLDNFNKSVRNIGSGIAAEAYATAFGQLTQANGQSSHAEGCNTVASGMESHAEGYQTNAEGAHAHSEGEETIASGKNSHAEGYKTEALEEGSHAEGRETHATGVDSHAEGRNTWARGVGSHAEGTESQILENCDSAHAEGYKTTAGATCAHAEGNQTQALGENSHAEGENTEAISLATHTEGFGTKAGGSIGLASNGVEVMANYSHAEGYMTEARGEAAHAEGWETEAIYGKGAHAEGWGTKANGGGGAHAEGFMTVADGSAAHAEGHYTYAHSGAHAEGSNTTAWNFAHVEGVDCIAKGNGTHVEGKGNAWLSDSEAIHVEGIGNNSIIKEATPTMVEEWGDNIGIAELSYTYSDSALPPMYPNITFFSVNQNEPLYTEAGRYIFVDSVYSYRTSGLIDSTFFYYTGLNDDEYYLYKLESEFVSDTMVIQKPSSSSYVYLYHNRGRLWEQNPALGRVYQSKILKKLEQIEQTQQDEEHYKGPAGLHIQGSYSKLNQNNNFLHIVGNGSSNLERSNAHTLDWDGNAEFAGDVIAYGCGGDNPISLKALAAKREGVGQTTEGSGEIFNDYENNQAQATFAHAEGRLAIAGGHCSHAEGEGAQASGVASHAEGYVTKASGDYSHAEGKDTIANGIVSHAEGYKTEASEDYSHAEGKDTIANGKYSHAEGHNTQASGVASHAEGYVTKATGGYSHAEGCGTIAITDYQHVQGKFNVEDTENTYAHIVGGGASLSNRRNIHTLDWDGNTMFAGDIKFKYNNTIQSLTNIIKNLQLQIDELKQ